jgi:hypothetical protein
MMRRTNERGMALVIAMFMVLMVSALGAAMVQVARTETLSSTTYMSMSQARYAAEGGVAAAANYLLSSNYAGVMPGTVGDPLAGYNVTASPVALLLNGNAVLLSSDPAVASNYPVAGVVTAFQAASSGTLAVDNGTVAYMARARLLGMRQINDAFSGQSRTLQTWEITGVGRRAVGINSGEVEVQAIIERSTRPVFNYAAFATANGCAALTLSGTTTTGSFNSGAAVVGTTPPPLDPPEERIGNVGTNGNLGQVGSATVQGTLSTPQSGVGACTANNVTAATLGNDSSVVGGLVQLPQPVDFPTPTAPNPMPPDNITHSLDGACPAAIALQCTVSGSEMTITPVPNVPIVLSNVRVGSNTQLTLKPGTYIFNSLDIGGGSRVIVDPAESGNVNIVLAGGGTVDPVLEVTGNGIGNTSWDPQRFRIEYAGTKEMKFAGTGNTAAIIYAPNAYANFTGTFDLYGSVIARTLSSSGTAGIYYDRRLQTETITVANPVMSTFTWRTF